MTRFILEKNSTKTISTISMPFQAIYFIRGVHKIYKIGLCSVLTSLNNIFCSSCRFYFSFSNTRTFSKVDPNYSYFSPPDGLAICWLHFYVINGHQLGVAPLPMFMNHFFFSEGIFLVAVVSVHRRRIKTEEKAKVVCLRGKNLFNSFPRQLFCPGRF